MTGKKTFRLISIITNVIILFFLLRPGLLRAKSGIYDRIGIDTDHGMHGAVPEENIDLFTGNLTLRFLDIRLPGPNGFDLEIWRVYNSKLVRDRIDAGLDSFYQQETKGWVGLGWTLHMGRVHSYDSAEPVIEFPDGRMETAYNDINSSYYITRSFLKYDINNYKLYFKDGTVWTFGHHCDLTTGTTTEAVRAVTRIENSYGHYITIAYVTEKPIITTITDSLGRQVLFDTDGATHPKLERIQVKNTTGSWQNYYYDVNEFASGYHKLSSYDPPELPASTYNYYENALRQEYELETVNTGLGGQMVYEYEDHVFKYYNYSLYTRVVNKKQIRFISGGTYYTWNYSYPAYETGTTGTVTVDGPLYDTYATYYGLTNTPSQDGWRVGLLQKKWFSDGSHTEELQWTNRQISAVEWVLLDQNLGTIKGPLLYKTIKTRAGDAESTEEYLYERSVVAQYGLPTKIKYYGGSDGTTLKNYKTLEYYFEGNSTYETRYLLSYVKNESDYGSSGTKLKETQTTFYTATGKYGAVDLVRKWKTGSTYLTWDYTYTSSNPNYITITVNLPGSAGTETYIYSYGTLKELRRPGYTELERGISTYTGAVLWEINQHGGRMDFSYDNINRIDGIGMPSGFNDIGVVWNNNSVIITQAGNTVVKYWDGMGRDRGHTENGDDKTLYYYKNRDAEGRVSSENKGSTDTAHTYSYQFDAAGNIKKITDPRGKMTNVSYSGDQKTVTDAQQNQVVFLYEGLPGLPTKLTDAMNRNTLYTYDGIGRLTQVVYNTYRTQTYSYNGMDQVVSESHPETGTISYTYNSENNLLTKVWDTVTLTYTYNISNQLTRTAAADETIDYTYDSRGRVEGISSNKGWERDQIYYNSLGSITHERQDIPGLGTKALSYTYSGNNNPASVTYPDGKTVDISNNGLNMPETVTFNNKSLIDGITYGPQKQPAYIDISGNNTGLTATYYNDGLLASTYLKKGTTYLYRASYGYDNVGNITSISNTIPVNNASFGYDDLYRLTSADYSTAERNYGYTYDAYGNLMEVKENNSTLFNRTFDSKNRINSTLFAYDGRGNTTRTPGYEYEWDRRNRLEEVTLDSGEKAAGFLYNERDLRLKATRLKPPVSITVTAPNGGEIYQAGTTQAITWTGIGTFENVSISYSTDNGNSWIEVTVSTPNDGSFGWSIPIVNSTQCLISVSALLEDASDQSDAVFTITPNPVLTLISPNGGEHWEAGSTQPITWDPAELAGYVKLEYSLDSGDDWNTITSSTANDGSYSWNIPDNINSSTCLVRVSDTAGTQSDVGDGVFTIYSGSAILVASPNGGETLAANSTYTITWTGGESGSNVTIDYSKNGGISWTTITGSTNNDGNYNWTVPNVVSSECLVRITDNNNGASDTSDAVFSITSAVSITVITPNGGESLAPGTTFTITWSSAGISGSVDILYSTDSGGSWYTIVSGTTNDGLHAWTVPGDLSDTCLVRVRQSSGGTFDDSDAVFQISEHEITLLSPNGGEVFEAGDQMTVTWSGAQWLDDVSILYTLSVSDTWHHLLDTPNTGSFTFAIPTFMQSDTCAIKVCGLDGIYRQPCDKSDDSFSVVAAGTHEMWITYPNGGEVLPGGSTQTITWRSTDNINIITIRYTTDNGATWKDIATSITNTGSYVWTVPHEPSQSCRIKITEVNGSGSDSSDSLFTITSDLPQCGESWESTGELSGSEIFYHIVYGDSRFITVGNNGGIRVSYNGINWYAMESGTTANLYGIAYGNGRFAAVGDNGTILTSDDGVQWTERSSGGPALKGITYGNNMFVAVGAFGAVYTSTNGTAWTARNSGVGDLLNGVTWGNSLFVAVGNNGIYTSPNGTTWTKTALAVTYALLDVIYAPEESLFVAVGNNGSIFTAGDGSSWTARTSGTGASLHAAAYGNSMFALVGDGGVVLTGDGINWTTQNPGTGQALYGAAYGNSMFAACGDERILVSLCGPANTGSYIRVTWPDGGETLEAGMLYDISWTSFGTVGDVKIELSTDYGDSWSDIAAATENDGTYAWTAPNLWSRQCLIRISQTDGLFADVSNGVFTIEPSVLPSVTVTAPNGGENWSVGTAYTVTWTSSGGFTDVALEYSTDNGQTYTTITASTPNTGTYNWTVPEAPSQLCKLRISAGDGSASDVNDNTFSIIPASPLTVTAPNGGESWEAGSAQTISWTDSSAVETVNIEYSIDSGQSWTVICDAAANNGSFGWTIPRQPSDFCLVRISGNDDGLAPDISDRVFSITADYTGACGRYWSAVDPPVTAALHAVTYGDTLSLLVAAGSAGAMLTSADGTTWTALTPVTANDLLGAAFGDGTFALVGENGTILSGTDGTTWTARTSGTSYTLRAVTYGGGLFVAVGDGGTILSSPDAVTWTPRPTGTTYSLYGIAWGDGLYAAVGSTGGSTGSAAIVTSPDSIAWTDRTPGLNGLKKALYDVAYGDHLFTAVGDGGTILTAGDGSSWEPRSSSVTAALLAVTYGNGTFVVVGDQGVILTGGGLSWQARSSGTSNDLTGAVYGLSQFTAVGRQTILYSLCGPVQPSIRVTAPNGGETWQTASTHDITWTWTGTVGPVDIDYSTDGGVNWTPVVSTAENNGAYPWTIPNEPSTHCLVRITENGGSVSDISNAVFEITADPEPSITVTSPNGGENLTVDSSFEITWTSTGTVDRVAVDYSINNGAAWMPVEDSTENDGGYLWTVPDTPSGDCLLRIRGIAEGEAPMDVSDAVFAVVSGASPELAVTSPNGGETLAPGAVYTITWTTSGTPARVRIDYSSDRGVSWSAISADTQNDGAYDWSVPGTPSAECFVRITGIGIDDPPTDSSDTVFTIAEPGAPVITVTAPNGGESLTAGSTFQVTWTTVGIVAAVDIDYSTDDRVSWTPAAANVENGESGGSYAWTVPGVLSDLCFVRVSQSSGAASDTGDAVFSIVSPAAITVTAPNGGESLAAGTFYSITWTYTPGANGAETVRIQFSTDNGGSWETIAPAAANNGNYDWWVPDVPSDLCLVRVSESGGDEAVSDTCDAVFSITAPASPVIRVTAPNGGETLTLGETYEITWVSAGATGLLTVEYSLDDGVSWTGIAADIQNNGSCSWTLPTDPAAVSDQSRVRVREADNEPMDTNDNVFAITEPTGDSLTLTAPNGGENVSAGSVYTVTWTSTGTVGSVILEYSTDGGETWILMAAGEENDGSFDWSVPETDSADCLVRISDNDQDRDPSDVSDAVFSIVSGVPSITVRSPNGAEGLTAGSLHEIRWTWTGTIDYVDIEYSLDNGGLWTAVAEAVENTGAYEWLVPAEFSDECLVRISGSDADETPRDSSDHVFSIVADTAPCGAVWHSGYLGGDSFNHVCFSGTTFVAVGEAGVIRTSANGKTWTPQNSGTSADLTAVGYGAGLFVIVGESGTMLTGMDGINWETGDSGVTQDLYGITFGSGVFVAVGANGTILVNATGLNWETISPPVSADINGIVYTGSSFAAVTGSGRVLTSTNGYDWTVRVTGTTKTLYGVAYGNGVFVAVGDNGTIVTGSGGADWTVRVSQVSTPLRSAAFGNNMFVLAGGSGKILTGSDGTSWVSRPSTVRDDLSAAAFGNNRFITTGTRVILYTLCDSGTTADNNPAHFSSARDENNSRMVYNDRMVEKMQVSDFEPSDFGFVSDFGFSASDLSTQKLHGPNMNGYMGTTSPAQGISHTKAGTYLDTYYIYSFDGKLLAEYDQNGNCVSDYIYAGNRLIAEYRPQTSEYFFYMNDQVNSTRVVTDEDGIEVYSASYSPYGDIHESGTNAVDPKLKFSGKERESYAELDYFGARYYDHNRYRFLSVDPVINKEEALSNPQLWNLYAYCGNNPITYLDPDGRISESMGKYEYTVAEHLAKASNDGVTPYIAEFIAEEVGTALVAGGIISAAKWLTRAKWLNRILNSSALRKAGEFIMKGLSKAQAKSVIEGMGLPKSQFNAVKNAISRATSTSSIKLTQNGPDVIVQIFRKGRNGFQVMESTVSMSGRKTVIQKAYNAAGKLVHEHLK